MCDQNDGVALSGEFLQQDATRAVAAMEKSTVGVVEEVKARLVKAGAKLSDMDGVRVSTKDGWWLLRASNTQPVLVARCEAADQAGLERLRNELKAALSASGIRLPDETSAGHH